jgi:signal transduction histidine kinase
VDVERIAATLNDYRTPLDGSTRLALMQQLRAVELNVKLPTQAGLRLAREWIDTRPIVPEPGSFHETALPGVWAFASDDRRAVALYHTSRLESLMHDLLHQVEPAGITFISFPPGVAADAEAVAAGMTMPGWQLSYVPLHTSMGQDDARRGTLRYLFVGAVGIVMIAALGATVGRGFLQQFRLARLKTDLVAAVSHELRTPLASIRVLVDGLLEDPQLDPRKTRDYLALIAAENARLHRLVENFLTFSRLDRGRYRFEFASIAPSTIVQAAVAAIRDRLPDGGNVRIEIAPDLPPLRADAAAVETALVNLLDNAIKYTPDDKRIRIRAQRDGDGYVSFVVEDNGVGIPAGEQRRIFTRFYRVDRRLARESGGVGLGLSIVELVARAHGGSVSVRSVAGEGASFTLRLPSAVQSVAV